MADVKTEVPPTEAAAEEKEEAVDVKPEDVKQENVKLEEENKDIPTMLQMKIIRQVEYYFGNVNLWRDKFLKEKVKEDDGWVTLECLITFNRLQALSVDFEEIVSALEKSKTGLLEIHEDRLKIRRSLKNPLPDPDDPILRKAAKMKTLYVKGFPTSYKLDDVQDFILSQGCQNIFIKMKQTEEKNFKGSIIVELATMEEAEKFLKQEIKCEDTVLKVIRRDEYFAQKNEQRHGKKPTGQKRKGENGTDELEAKKPKEDDEKEEEVPPKIGCVLHFKGCSTETSREDLKALFGEHEPIEWVDFDRGETQGYIRFVNEGAAKKALDAVKAANDDKVIIKEKECETKIIEGIEEKNYWILANEEKKRAKNNRFGGRGGRGGRGGGRGGRGGRNNKKGGRGDEGWKKRRREWEYDGRNKDTENKNDEDEEPKKNQHIKFDDDDGNNEVNEKKTKVEEEKPTVEA